MVQDQDGRNSHTNVSWSSILGPCRLFKTGLYSLDSCAKTAVNKCNVMLHAYAMWPSGDNRTHTFVQRRCSFRWDLGFSVLLKDTSTCWPQAPEIKPVTSSDLTVLQTVNNNKMMPAIITAKRMAENNRKGVLRWENTFALCRIHFSYVYNQYTQ